MYVSEASSTAQRDAVLNIFSGQACASSLFAQTITQHFPLPRVAWQGTG